LADLANRFNFTLQDQPMKKLIFAFACFISVTLAAQDTIYTRNGEVIPAKVYEITATEIKYKKPSNPDGPMYVTSKENVAVIEYKNGSKDVFQLPNEDDTYATGSKQTQASDPNYTHRSRVSVVIAPPAVVIGGWGWHRPYRIYRHWRRGCGWWW